MDCIKILLEQGASATNTRVDGITALMTASVAGHTAAVQMLLEVDAYPKAGDQDGLTQLMIAAKNYTVAILQLLTQAVDDIDHRAMYLNRHMNMPMRSSICRLRVTLLSIKRSNKSSTTTASRSDFWNSPRNKQS
jgi:ankyrin repeat protein